MSSADIEVVDLPNLQRIESFLNDSTYRETVEISASFNTRLCLERRSRMPFLDPQTGVAQKHCHLYMSPRQRMPGSHLGQAYTYPVSRWRKSKRQYLQKHHSFKPFRGFRAADYEDSLLSVSMHHEDSSSLGATCDTADLKDPGFKDDLPKDWLYEDMELQDMDGTDEAEAGDSDYEYNVNGYKRKGNSRRKSSRKNDSGASTSSRRSKPSGGSSGSGSSSRRSRKKANTTIEREHDFQDQYTPAYEPPSFESAAETLGDVNGDLRSYRKY